MSDPENKDNSTADWRKYPKGPNFLGIVIWASVILLVLLLLAYFVLGWDARKLMPHPPNQHPNSLVRPLLPESGLPELAA